MLPGVGPDATTLWCWALQAVALAALFAGAEL